MVDISTYDNQADIDTPDMYTGEPPRTSAASTWKKVQADLSYAIGANVHRSWTARLSVTDANAHDVVLTAPTRFIASKIKSDYFDTLCRLWTKHDEVAPPRKVKLAGPIHNQEAISEPIRPSTPRKRRLNQKITPGTSSMATPQKSALRSPAAQTHMTPDTNKAITGRRFSFDNFITGPANHFAYSAVRQVVTQDRVTYNPIVIYGKNGSGKTHLLYALKNAMEQEDALARINFLSAEQFVHEFVSSLTGTGNNRVAIQNFKAALRNVDVLIIDDAHFIANKPASHEELLQTLVAMISNETQVLVAMDRHPDDIEKASPRLKSYLRSGLVCGIEDMDYNLRLKVLDGFIADRIRQNPQTPSFPRPVREFLAARVKGTPRDLEGEYNRVAARAEMMGLAITIELAENSLADTRFTENLRLTMERIQKIVCEEFGLTLNDMVSKRRAQRVARPRQVAMCLCKTLTQKSLPEIGRKFGGRDHTTVLHAVKRIKELRAADSELDQRIKKIEHMLKPNAA